MNARKFFIALSCFALSLSACQKATHSETLLAKDQAVPTMAEAPATAGEAEATNDGIREPITQTAKKIIRNATLSIQVADLKTSIASFRALLEKHHATIESEQFFQYDHRTEQHWTIRVNPDNLDEVIDAMVESGIRIESRAIQAQDVTRGYIDVETRLKTKMDVLQQYQVLLKKATRIEEILKIQEHLRIVTEEIESAKAQLKSWDQETQQATIQLVLFQEHSGPVADHRGFFKQAFGKVIEGWTSIESMTLALIGWWPFFTFGGLVIYLWRRFKR